MLRDKISWSNVFQDLKVYKSNYGIIHGVPMTELNSTNMMDVKVIE